MMKTENTTSVSIFLRTISILLGLAFIVIGILNLILVHPVPGVFYILLSVAYFPFFDSFLSLKIGFKIPVVVKILIAFTVLWGTLAVGDLAEILGL